MHCAQDQDCLISLPSINACIEGSSWVSQCLQQIFLLTFVNLISGFFIGCGIFMIAIPVQSKNRKKLYKQQTPTPNIDLDKKGCSIKPPDLNTPNYWQQDSQVGYQSLKTDFVRVLVKNFSKFLLSHHDILLFSSKATPN